MRSPDAITDAAPSARFFNLALAPPPAGPFLFALWLSAQRPSAHEASFRPAMELLACH